MIRHTLTSFSLIAMGCLAACANGTDPGHDQYSPLVVEPGKCAPEDPACVPSDDPAWPCDPSATDCAPPPPCDPSDTNCDDGTQTKCAAQDITTDGCGAFFGYAWDGKQCVALDGCECKGSDCSAVFATEKECVSKYSSCLTGGIDDCTLLAGQLSTLLGSARSCNIASASAKAPCDGTLVPTVQGCPVPVANGSSEETKAYLELYEKFASVCPLPVPACPNPTGVPIDCVQAPDVDGLLGECSFTGDDATDPTKD